MTPAVLAAIVGLMKIIVTGGAGFIGSHLVDRLIKEGHEVIVLDNLSTGNKKNLNPKATFYKADIRSKAVEAIFKKERPGALFHFAAQIDVRKSIADPKHDASVNILGSLNLLETCRTYGVKKVVFPSTAGIYGDVDAVPTPETYPVQPISPYVVAKLSFEHYLHYYYKIHGLAFCVLRFANVYGPRQNSKGEGGVVAIFCKALISGRQPVIYGSGQQTRDFVFVADVVEANMLALRKGRTEVFNIGTGKETSVQELFQKIKRLTGFRKDALLGKARPGDLQKSCLDASKARQELGWVPAILLEEGVRHTWEWFDKNRA